MKQTLFFALVSLVLLGFGVTLNAQVGPPETSVPSMRALDSSRADQNAGYFKVRVSDSAPILGGNSKAEYSTSFYFKAVPKAEPALILHWVETVNSNPGRYYPQNRNRLWSYEINEAKFMSFLASSKAAFSDITDLQEAIHSFSEPQDPKRLPSETNPLAKFHRELIEYFDDETYRTHPVIYRDSPPSTAAEFPSLFRDAAKIIAKHGTRKRYGSRGELPRFTHGRFYGPTSY